MEFKIYDPDPETDKTDKPVINKAIKEIPMRKIPA